MNFLFRVEKPGACDDLQIISIVHLSFYEDTYVVIVFRSHLMRLTHTSSIFALQNFGQIG